MSGATVLYNAQNLDPVKRTFVVNLANGQNVQDRIIHVMEIAPEESHSKEISQDKLQSLADSLNCNYPEYSEGWSDICSHISHLIQEQEYAERDR